MVKNVPSLVPLNVPTSVPTWQNHWHNYNDPRPVKFRGKIAWAVTKPLILQKLKDKDKKLSSGTSDPKIAENVKWDVTARIYQWFDEQLEKLKPTIEHANRQEFLKLAEKQWVKIGKPAADFLSCFPFGDPEMDDVIREFHAKGIEVTNEMLDCLDDEARFWLIHHPSLSETTDKEKEFQARYGKHDVASVMDRLFVHAEALKNPATQETAVSAIKQELTRPEMREITLTNKDRDLANKLKTKNGKSSSTLTNVGERYINEHKWKKERTKSGAKLALARFGNLIGNTTDISDINAKHAYSYAKWMDTELGAANKSIKAAVSYVKGMFSWAITQEDYSITEPPWTKLDKIGDYGKEEESRSPFRQEQLVELFNLAALNGKGKMNQREHLLLSILITTGCRLDEAALLCWDNITQHQDGWHYIDLTKAIVKNKGSKRFLPLPDVLWKVMPQRGYKATVDGVRISLDDRLFDYSLDSDGKASRAASQACGRQLAKIKPEKNQVTHSLRGTLKDLLRDNGVSKELNDYITGHGQGDVAGNKYGEGHDIKHRYEALNLPAHNYIKPYGS